MIFMPNDEVHLYVNFRLQLYVGCLQLLFMDVYFS